MSLDTLVIVSLPAQSPFYQLVTQTLLYASVPAMLSAKGASCVYKALQCATHTENGNIIHAPNIVNFVTGIFSLF